MSRLSLVDTCGWIEWLSEGRLQNFFGKYFKSTKDLLVPTLIQYELYKWALRERDETVALNIIGLTEQCHVLALDTNIALTAADLASQHKLAMADAVIYACAQLKNVELITCDTHFKNLSGVIFKSKT